jgi:uncharacterized protein (TIGR03067 family)
MTRTAMFCGLALALIANTTAADDRKDMPKDLAPFQGTWKVVKADFGGKAPFGSHQPELRLTFNSDKVTVKEGKQAVEKGSFSLNAKKNPGHLDLVNSKGIKIQGIYKFELDGTLNLCLVSDKGARPKSFDTKNTKAGMMVLEKMKE